jgi:hypothetical protein
MPFASVSLSGMILQQQNEQRSATMRCSRKDIRFAAIRASSQSGHHHDWEESFAFGSEDSIGQRMSYASITLMSSLRLRHSHEKTGDIMCDRYVFVSPEEAWKKKKLTLPVPSILGFTVACTIC